MDVRALTSSLCFAAVARPDGPPDFLVHAFAIELHRAVRHADLHAARMLAGGGHARSSRTSRLRTNGSSSRWASSCANRRRRLRRTTRTTTSRASPGRRRHRSGPSAPDTTCGPRPSTCRWPSCRPGHGACSCRWPARCRTILDHEFGVGRRVARAVGDRGHADRRVVRARTALRGAVGRHPVVTALARRRGVAADVRRIVRGADVDGVRVIRSPRIEFIGVRRAVEDRQPAAQGIGVAPTPARTVGVAVVRIQDSHTPLYVPGTATAAPCR